MTDIAALLDSLSKSAFRRRFKLTGRERAYFAVKGRETVLEHGRAMIAQRLAPAHPRNDGKQTPFRGHPVFLAQHATATCCRGCIEKWHGIEKHQPLSQTQQSYILAVIAAWLDREASSDGRLAHSDAFLPHSARQLSLIKE